MVKKSKGTVKEDLAELSKMLSKMDPEKAKKVIAAAKLEISRLETFQLEARNFRVNSRGWKKIVVDNQNYLQNPDEDIWEILDGKCKGEQLFTWDAAMRETAKAGKRMPNYDEWLRFSKIKPSMDLSDSAKEMTSFDVQMMNPEDWSIYGKTQFTILNFVPAGFRQLDGRFNTRGERAYFWASQTDELNEKAWFKYYSLRYLKDEPGCPYLAPKLMGCSVRCLKN